MRIQEILTHSNLTENEVFLEAPLPDDWDASELGPKNSFERRLMYALDRAEKLGTGSSRVAMIIEYQGRDTVLKVAKNKKGFGQNAAEVSILKDGYAQQMGLLIPLIDFDGDHGNIHWVQTEKAEPIQSAQQLAKLLGVAKVEHIIGLAEFVEGNRRHRYYMPVSFFRSAQREAGFNDDQIDDAMNIANDIAELKRSYDLVTDDLLNHRNWGIWKGKPVIIDLGFTHAVHQNYYL